MERTLPMLVEPVDGVPGGAAPEPPHAVALRRRAAWTAAALAVLALAVLGLLLRSGEAGPAALAGVSYVPFLVLAALVQARSRWRWLAGLTWGWVWLLIGGFGLASLLFTAGALLTSSGQFGPGTGGTVLKAVGLIVLCLLLSIALVVSGWWLPLGRWLGGRVARGQPTHAQGVVLLVSFALIASVPLLVLGAKAPLLQMVQHDPAALQQAGRPHGQLLDQAYGLGWTLLVALVAAGWPGRSLRGTLTRLGLGPLRRGDFPALSGIVVGLVGLGFALDALTAALWGWAGWQRTDQSAVGQLFGAMTAMAPLGALATAAAAGLGEELLTRGLLQPRFGWLLPNLAFTAMHAYQYGPDAMLTVFVAGMVLATVRARWNTTASALVHGAYDAVLLLGMVFGLPGFS